MVRIKLAILSFPPVETADENGLLALGGDLEVESLLMAYQQGIFPWPINKRYPLAWFSPDPRGIVDYKDMHLSRSLKKSIKRFPWKVTFNHSFEKIIRNCAETKNRSQKEAQGTWITEEIIRAYNDFHNAGYAYSVEVWLDDKIVGGLYGVQIGNSVSGESMFHDIDDASKIALVSLMQVLYQNKIRWLDTQMVTSVVRDLGGSEITRSQFLHKLNHALYSSKTLDLNSYQLLDVKDLVLGQST